ncbi:uncharacterized protein LOC125944151 [Dermacentor silvarum]|uniref:uncharacterized protein LOC125944151 n=1 Tax=Dermacentor silvarum TaxID=543639 RepID=UPI002100DC17|nr:uncharacterized protein LOC125944151 [Dermacentor silvarum]
MSTVAARKRRRRRKLKPELSCGSTSLASNSLPSNMTAKLTELFARHKMQDIRDVAGKTAEAAASKHCSKDDVLATPETTAAKCKAQSSNSIKLFDTKECEASGSVVVEHETSIIAEDKVIVTEEPERKAPTESDVDALFIELESTLRKRDAVAVELKEKLEDLRESHADEVQELRVNSLQTPPPEQTGSATGLKTSTAKKKKPTGTHGEEDQVSPRPPQPRPKQRQRYALPRPRREKPHSLPIDRRRRPLPPSDKELKRYTTPPPVPDFNSVIVALLLDNLNAVPPKDHREQLETPRLEKKRKRSAYYSRMVRLKPVAFFSSAFFFMSIF